MRRLAFAFLLLTACTTTRPAIDLANREVVDLTYTYDAKTLYWPNSEGGFELKRLAFGETEGGYFYASNSFCTPEHGGTHLDAPIHFAKDHRTADQIPVAQLVAPAVVIDITGRAAGDVDYRLTAHDVRAWEAKHGAIARGTIVLLRTGWGKRYGDRKAYFGDDRPGRTDALHFPSYT
jgi:kynurenine formamidase